MTERFDRIVVGGGAMGLASTWQLASRGLRVLLLERFSPGHRRGASHGATRNMNNAYAEEHFLDLYDEALSLWRRLETVSGRRLLALTGLVSHGDPGKVLSAFDSLARRGAATELVSPDEAQRRWRGMRFEGEVLVNRDAGRVHSAEALEALADLSGAHGADLRHGQRVLRISSDGDRASVLAETPEGGRAEYLADGVIVTAGAWSEPLLGGLVDLPPLRVTEEHPAHFAILAPYADASWPSFNHFLPPERRTGYRGNVYGMLTPGEGLKIGFHATGDEVDPDERRFGAPDEARAQLREYVAEWYPGVDPDSAVEISCTYTTTPSERFVLDRRGPVTVGAGFSGQGFKFVPAIGRVLADASLGVAAPPEAFRLDAHW